MQQEKVDIIEAAMTGARELWPELSGILDRLPPTTCQRQAACCALLPEMTLTEACRLYDFLERLPRERREQLNLKTIEYYFLNPVRVMGCPFLENKNCLVYDVRPFGCRAYGLWSPWGYRSRSEAGIPAKRQVDKAWAAIGVRLPRQVVNFQVKYCREVEPLDDRKLDDRVLESARLDVQALDHRLGALAEAFAVKHFSDLGFVTACRFLGKDSALRNKVIVVREQLQSGDSPSLAYLLEQVREAFPAEGDSE